MDPFRLVIDGRKVPAKRCFEVLDPANEKRAGLAPLARKKDLDAAVRAARRAFEKWRDVPEAKRQAACLKIAAKIEKNAEELARLLTAEQGKPLNGLGSRWEIGGAVAWTRYTAGLSLPVKVLQDNAEGRVELHRKPIGVVGSITPWNFPVLIAVWHIVPAVLSGIRYRRIEDAIDRANDNANGLGGSVWSRNAQKAKRIADKLECGSVWINKHGMIQPNAPFGGVKHSGFGVEFGEEGLVEYTDIQVVFS